MKHIGRITDTANQIEPLINDHEQQEINIAIIQKGTENRLQTILEVNRGGKGYIDFVLKEASGSLIATSQGQTITNESIEIKMLNNIASPYGKLLYSWQQKKTYLGETLLISYILLAKKIEKSGIRLEAGTQAKPFYITTFDRFKEAGLIKDYVHKSATGSSNTHFYISL